ncbi:MULTISPECIES: orotate phosphoribosyltransferase [Stappiaceae]|jgi:orotate phosphoribosyltransferase|uniref:Orotate phosphoribosyltransferase n=1 Tax=Roseibium alexandrii (strain DSM 17067 / NCIMB 14079 / DFL-11) TaxID=244592 RepID=A0A5E8GWN6_ROSAD|nr:MULTISPECIES: orotate phosphoribosyltransferase [Stappiaceae]EEE43381.1 orotate phosphoribosyltransferase, Thermus family [Roseibium alexandrii DFL-11]MBO9424634.1 orotate phosphoribosyltransferase [Labrenzia sp. R4_1]
MTRDDVLSVFRDAGAILEGHFILTSGLRSPIFLQKARVFMYPDKTEILCKALAEKIQASDLGPLDFVVSPALGGLIPGYETARHLDVPAMWVEREDGEFRLRRFEMPEGARVIIVEDIVTTGLSSRETVTSLKALGAEVLAVACLIDRSGGEADAGVPVIALADYKVPAYEPDNLPPELAALPAVKPGSRGLA